MTPKQERFVAEYVKDLNATQAYIRAGYAAADANVNSARLMAKDSIKQAIAAKQAVIADKLEITAEKVLRDLENARLGAMAAGQYSAAARAAELHGKHIGMFVDRSEQVITERNVVSLPEVSKDAESWQEECAPKAH